MDDIIFMRAAARFTIAKRRCFPKGRNGGSRRGCFLDNVEADGCGGVGGGVEEEERQEAKEEEMR